MISALSYLKIDLVGEEGRGWLRKEKDASGIKERRLVYPKKIVEKESVVGCFLKKVSA